MLIARVGMMSEESVEEPAPPGAVWYVDNAATGANNGTSMANAWTSFANIAWGSIAPDDIIEVSGGPSTKTYNASLVVGASGTAGHPITIRRSTLAGHNGVPVINGQNTRSIGVDLGGRNHVVFTRFDVRNHTTSCIDCDGSGGVGVVVDDNEVVCGNTTGSPRGIDFRGCTGFIIRRNNVTAPSTSAGQMDCIVVNEVDDGLIEFNFCRVDNTNDTGHSDAFQFWDVGSLVVRYNTFISSTAGGNNHPCMLEAVHNGETVDFYGNVCWARGGQTCVQYFRDISLPETPGHGRINFWFNTIVGTGTVFNLDETSNVEIRGNIIAALASATPILFQGGQGDPPTGQVTDNLLWRPSGTTIATTVAQGARTYAQFTAAGFNASGLNADPLFVSVAAGDFRLQATSPAINQGTTLAAVTLDRDGVARPQGAAYDIGAYEFVPAVVPKSASDALSVALSEVAARSTALAASDTLLVRTNEVAADVLVFEDNFNSLSLDTGMSGAGNWIWMWRIWNVNVLTSNGEEAFKAWSGYNPGGGGQTPAAMGVVLHEVSGGTLKLYGRENPNPTGYGFNYLGGMISTELSHWQKYGIWECRAKFFSSNGHHWAMWLIAKDGSWPPELDIVEVVSDGANSNKLFMNAHGAPDLGALQYFADTVPVSSLPAYAPMASAAQWQDWHVYRLVWTSTTIEWWIDGVKRMSLPNYINQECFFLITPEIGGTWPGQPDVTTVWPQVAEIDYVRIYKGTEEPRLPWAETWTGANGAAWSTARWVNPSLTGTSVIDIQTNQGRMLPQGASFASARIEARAGALVDVEVTAQFTLETAGEQYHYINLRHFNGWSGTAPWDAYSFMAYNGNWELSVYVASVKTVLATGAVTWGTSAWNLRFRVEGTAIKVKFWQGVEPGPWNAEVTNSAVAASGIVSLVALNGTATTARPMRWDTLTVTML